MRKLIGICAAASAAVLVTFAVAIAMVAVQGSALNQDGQRYADASIVSIVSRWDANALLRRESSQLVHQIPSRSDVDRLFNGFKVLGALRTYEGALGHVSMMVASDGETVVTADYAARADFENGAAQIRLSLIKGINGWKILRFGVSPIVAKANALGQGV